MNIYEALELAATKRKQAAELEREANALEQEAVGVSTGEVLTVRMLVEVIRKVGQAQGMGPTVQEGDV